jgi:hypothetical protein
MALDTRFPAGMTRFSVLLKHLANQKSIVSSAHPIKVMVYYCDLPKVIRTRTLPFSLCHGVNLMFIKISLL